MDPISILSALGTSISVTKDSRGNAQHADLADKELGQGTAATLPRSDRLSKRLAAHE